MRSKMITRGVTRAAALLAFGLACSTSCTYDWTAADATGTEGAGGDIEPCEPNRVVACYDGPEGTKGVGTCRAGHKKCRPDGVGYGGCTDEVVPVPDDCTTDADENCDGAACAPALWAIASGNQNTDAVTSIAVVDDVTIAVAGMFDTSIALGGGEGAMNAGGPGIFLSVLDNAGHSHGDVALGDAAAGESFPYVPDPRTAIASDGSSIFVAGGSGPNLTFPGVASTTIAGQATAFVGAIAGPMFDQTSWVFRLGDGTGRQSADGVGIDPVRKLVHVAGRFAGTLQVPAPLTGAGANYNLFIATYAVDGTFVSAKAFGAAAATFESTGIAVARDGYYAVYGELEGGSVVVEDQMLSYHGSRDAFLVFFDPSGKVTFAKTYGDAATLQDATGAAFAADGTLVLVGRFNDTIDFGDGPLTAVSGEDVFVVKLRRDGTVVWKRRFGEPQPHDGNPDQQPYALALDQQGNIFLSGGFGTQLDFGDTSLHVVGTSPGEEDIFVAKLDPDGRPLWAQAFGGQQPERGLAAACDSAGDVYVGGTFASSTLEFNGGHVVTNAHEETLDAFLAKFRP